MRGAAQNAHPAHQRLLAFAAADGVGSLVQRHQRTRTRSVNRQAGAVQIEEIGDAIGDQRGVRAGRDVSLDGVERVAQVIAIVEGEDADIDAGTGTAECARVVAGILQAMPCLLEHDALLRVHHRRFAR
ncbi:MAG: hypothetical protein V4566_04585 [Pseudomonadota bacterium]